MLHTQGCPDSVAAEGAAVTAKLALGDVRGSSQQHRHLQTLVLIIACVRTVLAGPDAIGMAQESLLSGAQRIDGAAGEARVGAGAADPGGPGEGFSFSPGSAPSRALGRGSDPDPGATPAAGVGGRSPVQRGAPAGWGAPGRPRRGPPPAARPPDGA